jgi:hypothetical protein
VPTDYDAPRVRPEDEPVDAALSALQSGPAKPSRDETHEEESDPAAGLDRPGSDLTAEFFSGA